ncbi:MAG: hypothetical protein U0359_27615 [Byssovorax sp.]
MSARSSRIGEATVPLFYVLTVVSGLALLTARRLDELEAMGTLWLSVAVATAVGLGLAWFRARLWLALLVVFNAMWILPAVAVQVMHHMTGAWPVLSIFLLAFAPGALAAYFALSERLGLASFWFPAAIWMLSILDHSDDGALADPMSWVLLTALATLMLASFLLQESRRAALFQTHASRRLAPARPTVVLHKKPLRSVAQIAWAGSLGLVTLGLTGVVAPHLFQKEKFDGEHRGDTGAETDRAMEESGALPCCSGSSFDDEPEHRVREYFPFLHPRDEGHTAARPDACLACQNGVPITSGKAVAAAPGPYATATPASGAAAWNGQAWNGAPWTNGQPLPAGTATPVAQAPAPPPTVAPLLPPKLPKPAVAPVHIVPGHGAAPPSSARLPPIVVVKREEPIDLFPWLVAFAISAIVAQVSLRPLRRHLVVRHLLRPFWRETVDQRVSNLWQLVLIGLRDAGLYAGPEESPIELGKRAQIAGVDLCATVLERARHGVRVDAADLAAMEDAARAAYREARRRAGIFSRAGASLRWPLV